MSKGDRMFDPYALGYSVSQRQSIKKRNKHLLDRIRFHTKQTKYSKQPFLEQIEQPSEKRVATESSNAYVKHTLKSILNENVK